eukprot:TRINITY_DN2729_c0_g1_i1.p1 TRINITY_DN2729_c0_g1~~TRINITY_DN2729_c0_g1_i1.p1  ORF type:complete len:152 (-),score=41.79 TRINITY_DN2729_c0_g1_i1:206-661(-)
MDAFLVADERERLKSAFLKADPRGMSVPFSNLRTLLESTETPFTEETLEKAMNAVGMRDGEEIFLPSFLELCAFLIAKHMKQTLLEAFEVYDAKNDGKISENVLRRILEASPQLSQNPLLNATITKYSTAGTDGPSRVVNYKLLIDVLTQI